MPAPARAAFLAGALESFSGGVRPGASCPFQMAALAYFASLCPDAQAANELINSAVAPALVRALRQSLAEGGPGGAPLRARLAHVLGLAVRHAAVIADGLAQTGGLGLGLDRAGLASGPACRGLTWVTEVLAG